MSVGAKINPDAARHAQAREEGRVNFDEIANRHLGDTAVGVGLGLATWGAAPSDASLMRAVKEQFDPKRLLNPGRFLYGVSF